VSFTRDVKLELGTIVPATEHCRRAQLSGIFFGAGVFEIGPGGHFAVRISTGLPAVARHVLGMLKGFGVESSLRTMDAAPLGLRYEVILGDEARDLQLLNELGVLSDALRVQMTVPRRLVERRCCLAAFLRGLFLGCGSISAPGAPVHVELTVEHAGLAEQVRGLLGRLDLPFKLAERDRNVACYSKRSQTAADLLAVLGAHEACLRWEEHAVLGTVRGSANRLANCDEANARRAAAAAERQAADARLLMASSAWAALPASLREVAELRLAYPYLNLLELAGRANPPLSKSALNHRLRRLAVVADELRPTSVHKAARS
jgi:cell division protein WhiA